MRHQARRDGDGGTASIEMLLSAPLLALVLVLVVDLGYGLLVRARTDVAARFVGTTYVRAEVQNLGWTTTYPALQEHYGDRIEIRDLRVDEQPGFDVFEDGGWVGLGWSSWGDALGDWIGRLGSQQTVELVVERRPPLGTVLTDQPLEVTFDIDGEPWTYDEFPLSISGMTEALVEFGDVERWGEGALFGVFRVIAFLVGYVALGFFWLLGMVP